MAGDQLQQVLDYFKANPDLSQKAREYIALHPDEVKMALREIALLRGWDLSTIDAAAVEAQLLRMM